MSLYKSYVLVTEVARDPFNCRSWLKKELTLAKSSDACTRKCDYLTRPGTRLMCACAPAAHSSVTLLAHQQTNDKQALTNVVVTNVGPDELTVTWHDRANCWDYVHFTYVAKLSCGS